MQCISSYLTKKILEVLAANVIPVVPKPLLLMDFLSDAYNFGGVIGMLALEGLHILIAKHNLCVFVPFAITFLGSFPNSITKYTGC